MITTSHKNWFIFHCDWSVCDGCGLVSVSAGTWDHFSLYFTLLSFDAAPDISTRRPLTATFSKTNYTTLILWIHTFYVSSMYKTERRRKYEILFPSIYKKIFESILALWVFKSLRKYFVSSYKTLLMLLCKKCLSLQIVFFSISDQDK